jgi:hypothetical protein
MDIIMAQQVQYNKKWLHLYTEEVITHSNTSLSKALFYEINPTNDQDKEPILPLSPQKNKIHHHNNTTQHPQNLEQRHHSHILMITILEAPDVCVCLHVSRMFCCNHIILFHRIYIFWE